MAQTPYLNDGKSVVMFSDPRNRAARQREFAELLREHLGKDAEAEFLRMVDAMNLELELSEGRIAP